MNSFENAKKLVQKGKVAAIVLAGGQGTRLKVQGPKGCFPISIVRHKSLFQLLAEKVQACSIELGYALDLAIMTSKENHDETVLFFKKQNNFGLKNDQLSFFSQDSLPLLDNRKRVIIGPNGIKEGPCGNGAVFCSFLKSGQLFAWEDKGIEYINVMLVENALNDPYDIKFLQYHVQNKNDVTVKAVQRENEDEPVGVFVPKKEKLRVVEYSELSKADRIAKTKTGQLKYPLANISFFCFSVSFFKQMALLPLTSFPEHIAKKIDPKKDEIFYKREYFIFDVLPQAKKADTFIVERQDAFAPLKNLYGEDSPVTVQKALLAKDRRIFEALSDTKVSKARIFELSMDFHYPTESLKKKWKNKPLPEKLKYITP